MESNIFLKKSNLLKNLLHEVNSFTHWQIAEESFFPRERDKLPAFRRLLPERSHSPEMASEVCNESILLVGR